MLPPDLQQLMQGGGAPAGPAGIPPELAALLGGGGEPAPDEGQEATLPSDGAPGGGADPLEAAIALLDEAIALEADQEDQQVMRTCSAKLQSVLAKNQKEADGMMQGKMSPRGTRQAAAAAGAEGGY